MNKNHYSIGIFDSGIGGLTVLAEIEKKLPYENIVYLGDSASLPYGTKSEDTIIKLTTRNILFLLRKKVKLVVVACNTASSVALGRIGCFFSVPLFGVVEAGVKSALQKTKTGNIGIIGTTATINSQAYQKAVKTFLPKAKVYAKDCSLFVPLVEEGWHKSRIANAVAEKYLSGLRGKIDTLILGCTHYPLLKGVIRKVLPKVFLVDSAEGMAAMVKEYLSKLNLVNPQKKAGRKKFYLTDKTPNFARLSREILKRSFKPEVLDYV